MPQPKAAVAPVETNKSGKKPAAATATQAKPAEEVKQEENLEDIVGDSDDEDDFLMDDPMAFVERQDSQ